MLYEVITQPASVGPITHDAFLAMFTMPAAAEQPEAVAEEPAAPAVIATTSEQADIDRWALCPPVARPAALQNGIDADTINLQAA